MHDLVIRGGTVVDGTGAPARTADVAVADGRIAAVGSRSEVGAGRTEIDADGALVTPGWVDIHTHFDGQVTWDELLTPACWHGVTTVVTGNCGVGFAPCKPDERRRLIELMEGVEDIPGTALHEGMQWAWESFPEYLDFLATRPLVMDFGTQISHGPVRTYVMGERGARNEPATPADIAAMAAIVREAMEAGALGFTTSRTIMHRAIDGEPVPGTYAAEDELFGIGAALKAAGHGVFEVAPAGVAGEDDLAASREVAWMRRLAAAIGRPVAYGMTQSNASPDLYRELLAETQAAADAGAEVWMQVAGRATGLIFSLETTYHPLRGRPSFDALLPLPIAERVARLRDPAVRAAILSESAAKFSLLATFGDRIVPIGDEVDYEPAYEDSVAARAKREGRAPDAVLYDLMLERDGRRMFMIPILNYADGSLEPVREMLLHPRSVFGLGDAGAHCATISDASMTTTMLTHWARDRSRGDRLPLELAVKKMTADTSALYGLRDRGRIAPGLRADLNVIDLDRLRAHPPEVLYDLPGDCPRLIQRADGYVATAVAGRVTFREGEHTGELPGTLIRGRR
ncbi:N-acyl-D-amino-acid deacylase family protein [Yinghuangia soli]|uniref:Amidohydrolase family protein n=1 Tax=Yinghuangia soli TaxID=2908204 RepID=A0AA41TZS8_9ACTN|nr:amidohydrolase family protein [Yinghuangia soli]MCF2527821.1 amidohydrolase family protein [Yinghuangia soli]